MTRQSAGTLAPASRRMTSPTTRSQTLTVWVAPNLPLMTGTDCSWMVPWRSTNRVSLNQSAKETIVIMTTTAAIMDAPSTSPAAPFATAPHMPERMAEPATTHQSLSLQVCLRDSQSEVATGRGLVFWPKTAFLRRRSFSSPTIPV